ncbi:chemotaxis protein CheR [Myxococcus sp. K15C18031901]|uniref:CheR family methyltransferase n=1 Tax=Myxococcus dinghuensis TaxID=2906761 RepID=UPI0020A8311C|nr:CheR family methyltransferase [Myxococcus dinghuensis]MCP3100932.1 chemotaxis protein CheR [Myxococcus dinghuensis]
MSAGDSAAALEALEADLLLEGVARHWGFDLRSHARPLLLRRLRQHLREERLASFSALQARVLHDNEALEALLRTLSCAEPTLFTDVAFFQDFRARVVPVLRTWPSVRVWHVGCGTGEGTHALAILLHEEGLWSRCRLYASDACEGLLSDARTGVVPLPDAAAAARYVETGGKGRLSSWYTRDGDWAQLRPELRERIFFTQHNLATDGSFNEFQVVVCRDVLLAFDRTLHDRAHTRLHESLARFGFLCLGRKESLSRTPHAAAYEELEDTGRIFRRVT